MHLRGQSVNQNSFDSTDYKVRQVHVKGMHTNKTDQAYQIFHFECRQLIDAFCLSLTWVVIESVCFRRLHSQTITATQ